jgi:hypothetical protein
VRLGVFFLCGDSGAWPAPSAINSKIIASNSICGVSSAYHFVQNETCSNAGARGHIDRHGFCAARQSITLKTLKIHSGG